jgi:hypothetical protein
MAEHAATNSGLVLSDGIYNVLRQIVEKVFPGLGVLYAGLAVYWHWSNITEVVGTLSLLAVFGGILLSLARRGYEPLMDEPPGGYDGKVIEDVTEEGLPILRVELNPKATTDIMNKPQIVIKGYNASA